MLAVLPLGGMQPAHAATDYSNVRVLLSVGSGVKTMSVKLTGSYFVQETGEVVKGGTLTAKISGSKIALSHSSAGDLYTGASVTVMREKIDPSAGYVTATVGNTTRNYLGHFTFKYNSAGMRVINTVPLTHYLYGVVRGEMSNAFPIEALKAQAVAAKCYVLSAASTGGEYDIGDTAQDQVYKGYVASETTVHAAVNATYDTWLYLGSNILCAYYAASNGGSTILPSDEWGGTGRYVWDKAYARVEDPYDLRNPMSVQETIYVPYDGDNSRNMSSDMSAFLRAYTQAILLQQGLIGSRDVVTYINSVEALQMTAGVKAAPNAIIQATVTVNNDTVMVANAAFDITVFRYYNVFKKTTSLRVLTVTPNNKGGYFEIYQGRYGHGVGMSQRGAQQMANEGMKFDKILKFYYPGATIKSMGIAPPTDPVNTKAQQGGTLGTGAAGKTTGSVNFRKGPSTSDSTIKSLSKGTALTVLGTGYGKEKDWYFVDVNGTTGYIRSDFVEITGGSLPAPDTGTSGGTTGNVSGVAGTILSTVNMRTNPSTSTGNVVAGLGAGVSVTVVSTSGDFYLVRCTYEGRVYEGYVPANTVRVSGTPSTGNTGSTETPAPATATGKTNASVNFRKDPSTKNSPITKLAKNTALTILSLSGDWYQVVVNGTTGYIDKRYVTVTSTTAPSTDTGTSTGSTTATGTGKTNASVKFRKDPSTKNKEISTLKKNTELTILSLSGDWYQVIVNGTTGYISKKYVTVTSTAAPTTPATPGERMWSGRVHAEVRLRSTPSTTGTANILATLPAGTDLIIYSQSNGFYRVLVGTQEGYASIDYVTVTAEITSTASTTTGTTTGKVNVRNAPVSGSVLTTLKKGETVTILSLANGWYNITTAKGVTGYASAQYIKQK